MKIQWKTMQPWVRHWLERLALRFGLVPINWYERACDDIRWWRDECYRGEQAFRLRTAELQKQNLAMVEQLVKAANLKVPAPMMVIQDGKISIAEYQPEDFKA